MREALKQALTQGKRMGMTRAVYELIEAKEWRAAKLLAERLDIEIDWREEGCPDEEPRE